MITLTCKTCNRSFSKPTAGRAMIALRMHEHRAHIKSIVTPTGPRKPAAVNGVPPRKKYTKRHLTADVKINFCPQCGCDMHRVAMGLLLADKIKA